MPQSNTSGMFNAMGISIHEDLMLNPGTKPAGGKIKEPERVKREVKRI